jgi:F-type H+-transporting ATPase subunit a
MIGSPLATKIMFTVGPVPITEPVVVTWGLMAALALASLLATRSLALAPSRYQAVLELIVGTIEDQIRNTMRVTPKPYIPMIGTLFLFILAANWSSLIPGIDPPTAHIETDAALGLIVFFAIIYFGVRERGGAGYLKTFADPTIIMIPLNVIETFTRTFSLIVRLFGNIMSGVFLIGIVLSLAGLLVPIPLMALDLLIGTVQAYIFTVLAMVFIGSAVGEGPVNGNRQKETSWTISR